MSVREAFSDLNDIFIIFEDPKDKFVQLMEFKIFNHDFLVKKNIFIFPY